MPDRPPRQGQDRGDSVSIQQTPTDVQRESERRAGRQDGVEADNSAGSEELAGLDALISAGLLIVDREGSPPAGAAERVLRSMTPDTEAADELMVRGLASHINDVRERLNRYPKTADKDKAASFLGRFGIRTTHSPKRLADVMERTMLEGQAGHIKRLLDFTVEDARSFHKRASSQATGWKLRVRIMADYEAALTKHEAETGRDLPEAVIQRVRKAAEGVWG